ncbi:DUF262 domain-containing protein [Mycoplasmopsis columbina]|uniref:DUF262 domain-containing protein n=1 Tax=Mycoplasmopsis columbina TaxID=114881 RepID=UPI0004A779E2|nr:DUF262 domain-containing protein [Mycoplasmopsis columbina]VEU77179.1 Protein of uncharacterised function DUF262 [Mycoplasmopsis columbina]
MTKNDKIIKNNIFLKFWKLGTNAYSYFKDYLFAPLEKNKNEINEKKDFENVQIIFKDGLLLWKWNDHSFQLNKENQRVSSSTARQIFDIWSLCGFIKRDNKNKHYELEQEFITTLEKWLNDFNFFKEKCNSLIQDTFHSNLHELNNFLEKEDSLYELNYILSDVNRTETKESSIKNKMIELFTNNSKSSNFFTSIILSSEKNLSIVNYLSNLFDNLDNKDKSYWKDIANIIFHKQDNLNEIEKFWNLISEFANKEINISKIIDDAIVLKSNFEEIEKNSVAVVNTTSNLNEFITHEIYSVGNFLYSFSGFDKNRQKIPFKCDIPIFQRAYTWTRDLLEKFINDIYDSLIIEKMEYYNIGNISLCSKDENAGNVGINSLTQLVIDGQQRTITLALISYALFKLIQLINDMKMPELFIKMFKDSNFINTFVDLDNKISFKHLKNIFNDEKINKTKKDIIKIEGVDSNYLLNSYNVVDNLNYILEILIKKFNHDGVWDKNNLNSFVNSLLNKTILTLTTYKKIKFPSLLFEKMNSRSMQLNDLELIKNSLWSYMTTELKPKCVEKGIKIFSLFENILMNFDKLIISRFRKKDKTIDKNSLDLFAKCISRLLHIDLFKEKNLKHLTTFDILNIYFQYMLNKSIQINGLDLETYVQETNYSNNSKNMTFQTELFFKEIAIFKLINQDDNIYKEIEKNNSKLYISPFLDVSGGSNSASVFTPLIWSILNKFNYFEDKNEIFDSNILEWLHEIEKFHFKWKTSFFGGNSLTELMIKTANKIKNNEINSPFELKKELMSFSFVKDESNFEMDNVFENNKKRNYLLKKIEWFLINNLEMCPKNIKIKDKLINYFNFYKSKNSYEHIYPKKSKTFIEKHEDYKIVVEQLGNGLPLNKTLNSIVNNDWFDEKLKKYNDQLGQIGFNLLKGYKNKNFSDEYILIPVEELKDFENIKERTKQLENLLKKMYLSD